MQVKEINRFFDRFTIEQQHELRNVFEKGEEQGLIRLHKLLQRVDNENNVDKVMAILTTVISGDESPPQLVDGWDKHALQAACIATAATGNLSLLKRLSTYSVSFYGKELVAALQNGTSGGVPTSDGVGCAKFCLTKGTYDPEEAMFFAALIGHQEIILQIREANRHRDKGTCKHGLFGAAQGRHLQLMKQFEEWRANKFKKALEYAAHGGNRECIAYCLEKEKLSDSFNVIMRGAAKGGQLDTLIWAKESGATNFDEALAYAAWNGHLACMKKAVEFGATNFTMAIARAAQGRHPEIMRWCFAQAQEKNISVNVNFAMAYAGIGEDHECLGILIMHGATDYRSAMSTSTSGSPFYSSLKWRSSPGMSFASGGDILPHFFRNVNARDVSVALRESTPRPPILAIEAAPKPKGWISSKDLKKMHH